MSKSVQVVEIARGKPIGGEQGHDMEIQITSRVPVLTEGPTGSWSFESSAVWFDAQAEKLEIALHCSLPGGTYDRVLGRMLKRKSSHFIISHVRAPSTVTADMEDAIKKDPDSWHAFMAVLEGIAGSGQLSIDEQLWRAIERESVMAKLESEAGKELERQMLEEESSGD